MDFILSISNDTTVKPPRSLSSVFSNIRFVKSYLQLCELTDFFFNMWNGKDNFFYNESV